MSKIAGLARKGFHALRRAPLFFKQETGQSLVLWAVVALLNFATQIVFRRELAPGEFGTLNTALGVVGLMSVPLLAVNHVFACYPVRIHAPDRLDFVNSLRSVTLPVTETFAWAWGGLAFLLLFIVLPLIELPRFSLNLFTLLNVFIALGALLSGAVCQSRNQLRLWAGLLIAAGLIRIFLGASLAWSEPWAESGLAVFLLSGSITLIPALRQAETEISQRIKTLRTVVDGDFLLDLSATFSVMLAIFLFSSADRIVAQSWFGVVTHDNLGFVDWAAFDAYQTAGLLGRALLWGTQPLLLVFFAQRLRLERTTSASLTWFWIYLGALVAGAIFLTVFNQPLSWLFCGKNFGLTSSFVPIFAVVMTLLGLLQGFGMFFLASRRYPECFVLGGCGIGYTLLLYLVGRQPQLMPAYMFGGGLVSLMAVLLVGVVRWGRQPERILWNQSKNTP